MPLLHQEGQILLQHVRARAPDAQGRKATDHRFVQATVQSPLLTQRS